MTQLAVPLVIGSTILSAAGSLQQGAAAQTADLEQQQAEQYHAGELRTQAGQVAAAGERQQQNDLLQGKLAISSANAIEGASGGAEGGPGLATLEGQIAGRAEYNALTDLYSAQEQAAGLQTQARLDVYQGQQYAQAGTEAQQAGQIGAMAGILGGLGTAARIGALPTGSATAAPATNFYGIPSSFVAGGVQPVSGSILSSALPSMFQKYG